MYIDDALELLEITDNRKLNFQGYNEKEFKSNHPENHTAFYHRVGQTQDKDVIVFDAPEPLWRVQHQLSHDNKYLVLDLLGSHPRNTALFIGELPLDFNIKDKIECKPIVPTLEWQQHVRKSFYSIKVTIETIKFRFLQYVANIGPTFILHTNQNANHNRLVSFDFNTFGKNSTFTNFIAVINIFVDC